MGLNILVHVPCMSAHEMHVCFPPLHAARCACHACPCMRHTLAPACLPHPRSMLTWLALRGLTGVVLLCSAAA